MARHQHFVPQFDHVYGNAAVHKENEHRTFLVVVVTLVTMVVEIVAGFLTGSMALLSDGWHMGTHAGALGIAMFAYYYARTHQNDPRYTFGTGKVGVLAAFASAIILGVTGILIFYESIHRFLYPQNIHFDTAIFVAALGLIVNLICAAILGGTHNHHHHNHKNAHKNHHEHHEEKQYRHEQEHRTDSHTDQNLRAAFLHVLADALTSVLAIGALLVGKYCGLLQFDALAGLLGGVMILLWSYGLIRRASRVLLDGDVEPQIIEEIRKVIESDADNEVIDLHIWRIGENELAAVVALVSDRPNDPEHYRELLAEYHDLKHVIVEVHHCHCREAE
ncbi:MAG: CDF family Co(II)/Ni(II) efflux transporter DmeF [Planctomycetaceae bacterium]|jgi:cation diffusion facilitator family transporter|nr:CDF family Co(II)/Ni(II) efflux transporter DmeF [Planctomycetaceae bacterium]